MALAGAVGAAGDVPVMMRILTPQVVPLLATCGESG